MLKQKIIEGGCEREGFYEAVAGVGRMGAIISYIARTIGAKGLNKEALPDDHKVKSYLFQEEREQLKLLRQLPAFEQKSVSLLYPGCGADILFPLFYLEQLFPKLEQAQLTLIDRHHPAAVIKTVLDDVGVSLAEVSYVESANVARENDTTIRFYWKKSLMTIHFREANIFEILNQLPSFDFYFERAFRIMKNGHSQYERKIVEKLMPGGLVVSDSGFLNLPLTYYPIPPQLSVYGEMVVGKKEKEKK